MAIGKRGAIKTQSTPQVEADPTGSVTLTDPYALPARNAAVAAERAAAIPAGAKVMRFGSFTRVVLPRPDIDAMSPETRRLLELGKLWQRCPDCGRDEAAHAYCSLCDRNMGPVDWGTWAEIYPDRAAVISRTLASRGAPFAKKVA